MASGVETGKLTGPGPHLVTRLPGPRAAALVARDDQVLSPSYTRDYPLVAHRGSGCLLEDVDGNVFLDFTAGLAVTSTGHCHPEVVAAIVDQASRLIHMSGTDFYYRPEIELAELLAALCPGNFPKRVFFTNSGTESIEAAIKLARYATGRSRLIAFEGAFHGRSCGALSLSGSKAVHQRGFGPLLAGVSRLPWNATEEDFDRLFRQSCPAEEVAAMVVEPIQGEGGYRLPDEDFLPRVERICRQNGILLVADEIQTGIGRTGKMLAVEHFSVTPDVICLAKGLASGLPLGAVVARADAMRWQPGSHASTFGGNPVSCAAALATLRLVRDEYLPKVPELGRSLHEGLLALARRQPALGPVRGVGLMQAVDLRPGGPEPLAERRSAVLRAAFEQGLLVVGCGSAAVRFCPALSVTAEQIGIALALFDRAVAQVTHGH